VCVCVCVCVCVFGGGGGGEEEQWTQTWILLCKLGHTALCVKADSLSVPHRAVEELFGVGKMCA
jgi:hypothetical protein